MSVPTAQHGLFSLLPYACCPHPCSWDLPPLAFLEEGLAPPRPTLPSQLFHSSSLQKLTEAATPPLLPPSLPTGTHSSSPPLPVPAAEVNKSFGLHPRHPPSLYPSDCSECPPTLGLSFPFWWLRLLMA